MNENNNNNSTKLTKGRVTYKSSIILSVINLATKEIAGVSSLVSKVGSALDRWFKRNYYEGVKVSYNRDGSILVDVYINVYYGFNVSEISYRIQENIKNSIASMIDMKIDKINVHVIGVDFSKQDDII